MPVSTRLDASGKPLRNQNLTRITRKKPLSEAQKARGRSIGTLLRQQLNSKGIALEDIPERFEFETKTIIKHIREGRVTLLELLQISDFVTLDINSLLLTCRDERVAKVAAKRTEPDTMAPVRSTSEPTSLNDLSDDDRETAAMLGVSW